MSRTHFVRVFLHLVVHFELSAFERGCDIGCGNEQDTHAVEIEVNKGPVKMEDERMTDDIRYTLCHKSGKLWCFNRLRILRIVGFVEKMKPQRS